MLGIIIFFISHIFMVNGVSLPQCPRTHHSLGQAELLNRQMATFSLGTASGCKTMNFGRITHWRITEKTSVQCQRETSQDVRPDGGKYCASNAPIEMMNPLHDYAFWCLI